MLMFLIIGTLLYLAPCIRCEDITCDSGICPDCPFTIICSQDSSATPSCDCSSCGCLQGQPNLCNTQFIIRAETISITYTSDDITNTIVGNDADKATKLTTTLFNPTGIRKAEVQIINNHLTTINEDINFFQSVLDVLEQSVADEDLALKTKIQGSIQFYEDLKQYLTYKLTVLPIGYECFDDSNCPNVCVDCVCHRCRDNADCANEPGKPNCRPNQSGVTICGDPHISQSITGSDKNFCYDFIGEQGKSYLFLDDFGIEIVARLSEGDGNSSNAELVEYVNDLTITVGGVVIQLTPQNIKIKESGTPTRIIRWAIQEISNDVGWISVSRKQAKVYLREGDTTVNVIRKGLLRHTSFLNFGISEVNGLSKKAGGIVGSIANEAVFIQGSNTTTGSGDFISWSGIMVPVNIDSKLCLKVDPMYEYKLNKQFEKFQTKKLDFLEK
ncbi:unnamed protein product [Owenia fusiformis]|uniref:Uncharacterized protein n=1 Tax=Owenia fusiformis TaxID=6347 RepID=A0A8J1YAN7_OWEFU|nr:unnamed protein product [Owenia fusiformis]